MLDIKKIRANPEKVLKDLSKKDKDINLKSILSTDKKLKSLTTKLTDLQAKQNSISKEIGQLKSKRDSELLAISEPSTWLLLKYKVSI